MKPSSESRVGYVMMPEEGPSQTIVAGDGRAQSGGGSGRGELRAGN
jgi:hypothetical protein